MPGAGGGRRGSSLRSTEAWCKWFLILTVVVVTGRRSNTLNDTLKWVSFTVYNLYLNLKEITEKSQGFPNAYRIADLPPISCFPHCSNNQLFKMSCALRAEISCHCLALKTQLFHINYWVLQAVSLLSQPSHSQANKLDALPLGSYNAWYLPNTAFKEMYYTYYW